MSWTLYGKEYDLTAFLKRHPGGELALRLGQGRDCSVLFEQYHVLNDNHVRMLRGFGLYGEPVPDAFYKELRAAVASLDDIKTTPLMVAILSGLGLLNGWAWLGWYSGSWLSAVMLPFLSWLFVVNMAHDAAHFAFSRYAALNEVAALFSGPLFYNTTYWYLQHNVSHHMNTNHIHADIDLHHVEKLVRSHVAHKWLPAHKYQILSVCALNSILTTFSENVLFPLQLLMADAVNDRFFGAVNHVLKYNRAVLFAQLGLSLGVVVYPFLAFGLLKGLFFALWPFMCGSLLFITVTQISHIQESTQRRSSGWAHWSHQMVDSSFDYAQDSWIWTFLTGGLNMQGLHHCVPGLSSSRFQQVYPLYRALCVKHGLVIHESRTFWEAVQRYWIYLYRLSKERIE
jgi:fatty acid desaturase